MVAWTACDLTASCHSTSFAGVRNCFKSGGMIAVLLAPSKKGAGNWELPWFFICFWSVPTMGACIGAGWHSGCLQPSLFRFQTRVTVNTNQWFEVHQPQSCMTRANVVGTRGRFMWMWIVLIALRCLGSSSQRQAQNLSQLCRNYHELPCILTLKLVSKRFIGFTTFHHIKILGGNELPLSQGLSD